MSRSRKVGFSKLLNIDDVLEKFFSYGVVHRIQAEEVPIVSSVGRVLASNLVTNIDLPPYDRSAVDGFALKAEDTLRSSESNPVSLKIVDTVEIGTTPKVPIRRLEAVRISTGAPRPVGADAVVMIEHAEQKKDQVKIFNPISAPKCLRSNPTFLDFER